jgi:hypothetical protein
MPNCVELWALELGNAVLQNLSKLKNKNPTAAFQAAPNLAKLIAVPEESAAFQAAPNLAKLVAVPEESAAFQVAPNLAIFISPTSSQVKRKDEVMSVEAQLNDGISISMPDITESIVNTSTSSTSISWSVAYLASSCVRGKTLV